MDTKRMSGVDLHFQDGEPRPATAIKLDEPEALHQWFHSHPSELGSDTTVHVRILCVRVDHSTLPSDSLQGFKVPLPSEIVEHAMWKPEVYYNLAKNPAGGAAGLLDNPWRFILQTPLDGGPFCSLAMSRQGNAVKGIYCYDHDDFNPLHMAGGEASFSGWRSSGLQIVTLPQMFLQTHCMQVSKLLSGNVARVKEVETLLACGGQSPLDFAALSRELHVCNAALVDLERRSRFEQCVVDAIQTVADQDKRYGGNPWGPLAPQKTIMSSRSFDFDSLPRRIANARATISNLIQQRNEQTNLQLTEASFRIAEATLSDSKSMKTIAILTMILLPATAVASVFSMNFFNWDATDGANIASKWTWVYFVVTIPMTVLIMIVWWIWNRQSAGVSRSRYHRQQAAGGDPFRDEEAAVGQSTSSASIEMQNTQPKHDTSP